MKRALISQKFRQDLEPMVPVCKPSLEGGRPWCDDGAAFDGILFVLLTGIAWEDLPQELGNGRPRAFGIVCTRPCSTACADTTRSTGVGHASMARASRAPGGPGHRAEPDRGRLGSKRHVLTDARGVPLAILVSGADRHDSMLFEDLIDAVQPVGGLQGRPRKRPDKVHADKGYDYAKCRRA